MGSMGIKTLLRKTILVTVAILATVTTFGQDPQFTQFYANPLYLNPAFAGTARCPRVVLNYRNQWPALSGTFVTSSASYDQHIKGISGGLGFIVTHDQAGKGTLNTTTVSGIYSYLLPLSRKLSMKFAGQAKPLTSRSPWIGANSPSAT